MYKGLFNIRIEYDDEPIFKGKKVTIEQLDDVMSDLRRKMK